MLERLYSAIFFKQMTAFKRFPLLFIQISGERQVILDPKKKTLCNTRRNFTLNMKHKCSSFSSSSSKDIVRRCCCICRDMEFQVARIAKPFSPFSRDAPPTLHVLLFPLPCIVLFPRLSAPVLSIELCVNGLLNETPALSRGSETMLISSLGRPRRWTWAKYP